ncbi:hypothetical protein MRX96_009762 [Rhipicephalus microplus]
MLLVCLIRQIIFASSDMKRNNSFGKVIWLHMKHCEDPRAERVPDSRKTPLVAGWLPAELQPEARPGVHLPRDLISVLSSALAALNTLQLLYQFFDRAAG